jgi:hypothetical protein
LPRNFLPSVSSTLSSRLEGTRTGAGYGYQHVLGYLLIEVCLAWGGRSITLAQTVIEHGSAMVGFDQYLPVLEAAKALLPAGSHPTLLADRGFEHRDLMRWLIKKGWDWAIRVKSDLLVTLGNGRQRSLHSLSQA